MKSYFSINAKMIRFVAILVFITLPTFEAHNSITTGYGEPLSYKDALLTVGPRGPALLEDVEFIDEMAHFDRERIPERVVHAKGAGAFGYFEVTNDITAYCGAALFSEVGKRTKIAVRFSTVAGESGSADTLRDPRGFAIKFYTEEGNWDLVGLDLPVFFIKDASLFPSFIHTQKRNPRTHLKDPDMQWDFFTLRQETTHMLMYLFSDKGTPYGFRFMDGFGVNTFKLINIDGEQFYAKFHYVCNQGNKNLTASEAATLQSDDADFATKDLFDAIEKGDYPSWTFKVQIMTEKQSQEVSFNPFDDTKTWSETDFPLIEIGQFVLNENPQNYFEDIEQIAFSPGRMVPGIRPSPDKMLQGRSFSYPDTQRYRLGANFLQIPVNKPLTFHNYQRDGGMAYDNQKNNTNYHPNSFDNLTISDRAKALAPTYNLTGTVMRDDTVDDNFSQATILYEETFSETDRQHLIENLASAISQASLPIQERAVAMFENVSEDLCNRLKQKLGL